MTKLIKDMTIKEKEDYKNEVLNKILGVNPESFIKHYIKEEVIKSYLGKQTESSTVYIDHQTSRKYNIVRKKTT